MPLRQIPVVFMVLTGCLFAEPDTCTRPRSDLPVEMALSDEGLLVDVCGGGAVWVEEAGELVARRRLELRVDGDGALRDEFGNPVYGMVGFRNELDLVSVNLEDYPAWGGIYMAGNLSADQPLDPIPFQLTDPSNTSLPTMNHCRHRCRLFPPRKRARVLGRRDNQRARKGGPRMATRTSYLAGFTPTASIVQGA